MDTRNLEVVLKSMATWGKRWAPMPLRIMVGYGFMAHGFAKLSKGPDAFAGILLALGVPMPHLMAWLTIGVELLGGLAVLLGAYVAIASVPMAVVLLVAIFTVHLPYGFSSIKLMAVHGGRAQFGPPGYECDLLYLACMAALVLGGSGPFSLTGRREALSTLVHGAAAYLPVAGLRFLASLVTNDTKSAR